MAVERRNGRVCGQDVEATFSVAHHIISPADIEADGYAEDGYTDHSLHVTFSASTGFCVYSWSIATF